MPILLQILLYQSLFLLAYQLIKREPFFQLNRWYLLLSLVASLVLPFMELNWFQLPVEAETLQKINNVYLPQIEIGVQSNSTSTAISQEASISLISILENLYILGFSIAFGVLYLKMKTIFQLIQQHRATSEKEFNLIYLNQTKEAFSFYRYIFLGKEINSEEQQTILAHEREHVRFKHSYDISLLALLRLFLWFNPLLYVYQRELQLVHEYQADAKVCEQYNPNNYVWQLLNTAFETKNMSLMSSFYTTSFIKNRITMLQRRKKSTRSLIRYTLITPILLFAFSFSLTAQSELPNDEQALLEKYKKEINALVEKKDMSVYYDYVINVEKDKNGILTKDAFYRMKAFATLAYENGMSPNEKEDKSFINKDYRTYVDEMKKKKRKLVFNSKTKETKKQYDDEVPFASVDQVPIYPGCDESMSNDELRKCMSEKITQHVHENFDTSLAKKLELGTFNRVYVRFKIDKNGNITDVRARAAHPKLSDEGLKTIESLPKMKPGIHNDKAVNIIYTLPISFTIAENETLTEDDK